MMNCEVADTNHVVFVQRGERGVKVNPFVVVSMRRGLWGVGGEGSSIISKSKVFFIFIGGGRGGYQ